MVSFWGKHSCRRATVAPDQVLDDVPPDWPTGSDSPYGYDVVCGAYVDGRWRDVRPGDAHALLYEAASERWPEPAVSVVRGWTGDRSLTWGDLITAMNQASAPAEIEAWLHVGNTAPGFARSRGWQLGFTQDWLLTVDPIPAALLDRFRPLLPLPQLRSTKSQSLLSACEPLERPLDRLTDDDLVIALHDAVDTSSRLLHQARELIDTWRTHAAGSAAPLQPPFDVEWSPAGWYLQEDPFAGRRLRGGFGYFKPMERVAAEERIERLGVAHRSLVSSLLLAAQHRRPPTWDELDPALQGFEAARTEHEHAAALCRWFR